jgi:hypothetical protein
MAPESRQDVSQGIDRGIFGALAEWVRRAARVIESTATRLIIRIPAGALGRIEFTRADGQPVAAISSTWALDVSGAPAVTLANDATATIGGVNVFAGLLVVHDLTSKATAIFLVGSSLVMTDQTLVGVATKFSDVANNAGYVCIYLSGNQITVQNKTGAPATIHWAGIRLGAATA